MIPLRHTQCTGIAILGGTFNPVHIGHLRLALEVSEALAGIRTELVPCAVPPHKEKKGVLPFELRHAMLRASTENLPNIFDNDLEGKRAGPSFTYDTLAAYNDALHGKKEHIFFCLGLGDFMLLNTWHKGLELPDLAQLVVIPRGREKLEDFARTVQSFWPESKECPGEAPFTKTCLLRHGKKVHALSLPRLDLSSSFIRSRWRTGRNLAFLVPDQALRLLYQHKDIVMHHWNSE